MSNKFYVTIIILLTAALFFFIWLNHRNAELNRDLLDAAFSAQRTYIV